MKLLSAGLQAKLRRARIGVRTAPAMAGHGERRSAMVGGGIEFAEYRPYREGDDLRALDPHVYARLGQHVVRRYAVDRQLSLTILVDRTASMDFSHPTKAQRALELAGALAYIGLVGGDQVRVGTFSGDGVAWAPMRTGLSRGIAVLEWLGRQHLGGTVSLAEVAVASGRILSTPGMLVLISDWWSEGVAAALARWRAARQEIVMVHLLSPEERDPGLLGDGPIRFIDKETGQAVDAVLSPERLAEHHRALAAWTQTLVDEAYRVQGRYLLTSTADDLEHTLLGSWRRAGLVT
jgi:uncharacterized protein (DUF58 family)